MRVTLASSVAASSSFSRCLICASSALISAASCWHQLVVVTELRDGLVGLLQQIVALGDQIGLGVADGAALDGD